jgi:hypothetical protein
MDAQALTAMRGSELLLHIDHVISVLARRAATENVVFSDDDRLALTFVAAALRVVRSWGLDGAASDAKLPQKVKGECCAAFIAQGRAPLVIEARSTKQTVAA